MQETGHGDGAHIVSKIKEICMFGRLVRYPYDKLLTHTWPINVKFLTHTWAIYDKFLNCVSDTPLSGFMKNMAWGCFQACSQSLLIRISPPNSASFKSALSFLYTLNWWNIRTTALLPYCGCILIYSSLIKLLLVITQLVLIDLTIHSWMQSSVAKWTRH